MRRLGLGAWSNYALVAAGLVLAWVAWQSQVSIADRDAIRAGHAATRQRVDRNSERLDLLRATTNEAIAGHVEINGRLARIEAKLDALGKAP
jgi:hypothetical protein